ncbi:MAG: hypothetical protein DUD27_01825 [Lachnospiraceae bacterium]|nr:MAG: hypothetical protein DUD27_01825 [Lachnospiraceae bacterium]
MHVSSTSVARGGVFTALAVICILLTNVFSTSTLFLLIIAACFTAFAYSFSGLKFGIAALAAGAILGLFLSPRKGIIFTYVGIALYLILAQVIERHFYDKGMLKYWGLKCLVFNALFWGLFFIAISVAGVTGIFSAKAIANFNKMDYKWALILLFVVAVEFCFAVIDRVFFMARNRLEPILMKSER